MSSENGNRSHTGAVKHAAAEWLSRRDRGLTAIEQDDYLQWLQESPLHGAAIAEHERTLRRLTQLKNWQPAQSLEPDPDLFAPALGRHRRLIPAGLAVAAVLAVGFVAWWHRSWAPAKEGGPKTYLVVNECQVLPDGSVVEIKNGSMISVQYTAAERRVCLMGEEASFTVAKNPARPFLVETRGVVVRAIGTVFDVRLDSESVQVLVTEGKVRLEQPLATGRLLPAHDVPVVSAGQRATVSSAPAAPPLNVTRLTPEEIGEALAWQKPQFRFYETRLADAVADFNRHNRCQLVLGEPGLGSIPIGGTFREDNVEGFARLLEVTLSLRAERWDSDKIVLTRAR
jgi:transmembrane sensor